MKISYVADRFVSYSSIDEKDFLKKEGFEWDAELKRWTTFNYKVAEKLIGFCDESATFQIGRMKLEAKGQIEDSAKVSSDIQLYYPDGVEPYPFQVAGVEYILPRPACLLADEMGTGKSCQAILTINCRVCNVLIVCPKVVKWNWMKELNTWLIGEFILYYYMPKKIRYFKGRNTNHKKQTIIHVINYDLLAKYSEHLSNEDYNFFVADESHAIKNPNARRTRFAISLAEKCPYRLLITGTPIFNKPKDLWTTLNLMDGELFGNPTAFLRRYCGMSSFSSWQQKPQNIEELNQLLRANYMVRRMKRDVLKDLPEKVKDMIVLQESELDAVVKKEKAVFDSIKEKQKELDEWKSKIKEAGGIKNLPTHYQQQVKELREQRFASIGDLSTIRHELAKKKAPYVAEFVKEILDSMDDQTGKVVVFAHHKAVVKTLMEKFENYNPVSITGSTKDEDREKAIVDFQNNDEVRVFVGNMQAAGVGITLTAASIAVFAELDWTPAIVAQSEDRLHRISQKNTVWVYHIVADDSLDSRIAKMLVSKEKIAAKILDYDKEAMMEELMKDAA